MSNTHRKAAIAFILVTVILDVLSLGIVIPVLPNLLRQMLDDDQQQTSFYQGLFGTIWATMQFIVSPIMGALSDRYGRRPILLLSAFGLGLDYILMALAPNLTWLLVGRVLSGITAASFSTASAYIADTSSPENRSAAFGMFGAAFGLGFILGPALGGWLGSYNLQLPFWVSAALTLTNACYGFFILPESLPVEKRSKFQWSRANPVGSLRLLQSAPGLLPLAMTVFAYQLAHQVFQSVFVLYTGFRFHWTPDIVGFTLATVGILNFVVQGILIRPAIKVIGERRLVFLGLTGGIVGFASYAIASNEWQFFFCTIIFALMGFFNASIQGIMSRKISPSQQGQLSGANSAIAGIAGMIGPTLFTGVYMLTSHPDHPWMQGAPFALASTILSVGLVVAIVYVPKGHAVVAEAS